MRKLASLTVTAIGLMTAVLATGCLSEQEAAEQPAQVETSDDALKAGAEVSGAEKLVSRAGVEDESGDDEIAQDKSGKKGDTLCKNHRTVGYMQSKVVKYCKGGNPNGNDNTLACSSALTCSEISRRTTATAWCLEARINIVKQCYDGKPDAAHAERLNYHSKRLSTCLATEDAAVAVGRCAPAGKHAPYPG